MKAAVNQKGYTMVETIMYISLLIILGGVLAGYAHKVISRYKTGRTTQQVIDLKKAIINFTASDEDYSQLSIAAMDQGHSLPMDMRNGDHVTAHHALGGSVQLGPASDDILGDTSENKDFMFYIRFNNLPKDSCVEILTQGQFYGDGSEMDTLIVNGKFAWQYEHSFYNTDNYSGGNPEVKILTPGTGVNAVPSIRLTITDAVHACSEKDTNHITWIFS